MAKTAIKEAPNGRTAPDLVDRPAGPTEFDFQLTSRTALLMSADNLEAADELTRWQDDPVNKDFSKAGDDRTPPWTWMIRLHHDGERLAIPENVIMAMLREAGKKIPVAGKGNKTYKEVTQSGLLIPEEYCSLVGPQGPILLADLQAIRPQTFAQQCEAVQPFGLKLDRRRVSIPGRRSKHVRVRARFESWTVTGRIEILDPLITPEILRTLFRLGGCKCGLLDWRPNAPKPGPHGQFESVLTPVHQVVPRG